LAIDPNNTFALTNKDAILHMLGNNITPGNATNFLEYENSTYRIKMQYPSDWTVEGGSNPAIIASFYPQRNYSSYVMIQIENLSTGAIELEKVIKHTACNILQMRQDTLIIYQPCKT
jgi:hypothetical protein